MRRIIGAVLAVLRLAAHTNLERFTMLRFTIVALALCFILAFPLHAGEKTVKVFILAGQSNMEGKAPNQLLEHQAKDPKTRQLFAHLRKDDKWIVRDDVFVKFLDRHGPLTIGYGSPGRTGVELEFGTLMGNHFEEPVILVKAAWGGHSLFKHFRSPSAGLSCRGGAPEGTRADAGERQEKQRKEQEERPAADDGGHQEPVRLVVPQDDGGSERRDGQLRHAVPGTQGQKKLELAGFVWFQGWNDQYGAQDEYASNMKHFIDDVRKDLHAPKLPFVIGVMGQNGSKPATGAMLTIQKAQLVDERRP